MWDFATNVITVSKVNTFQTINLVVIQTVSVENCKCSKGKGKITQSYAYTSTNACYDLSVMYQYLCTCRLMSSNKIIMLTGYI